MGWARSLSRLTTGAAPTAAMRSTVEWLSTLAPMKRW